MSKFLRLDGSFDKDKWILDAIEAKYLIVYENGEIWRRKFASQDGKRMSADVALVKPRTHKATGRVYFNMTWKGYTKSVLVNRVIALRFLPNPLNLPQVNHIDGDKSHNYLYQPTPELRAKYGKYQLEWSSGVDNERHAHRNGLKTGRGSQNSNAKLDTNAVLRIRKAHEEGMKIADIAKQEGVSRSAVVNVVKRRTWQHV